MKSTFRPSIFFTVLLLMSLRCLAEPSPSPDWVWHRETSHEDLPFQLDIDPGQFPPDSDITLRVVTDFAGFEVSYGGRVVAESAPYDPPLVVSLGDLMTGDGGRIEIKAHPVEGPSAIAASLTLVAAPDNRTVLLSGRDEAFSGSPSRSRGKVTAERWAENRLPEVSPFAEYNQWKEASSRDPKQDILSTISYLADGFKVECLRIADEEEGSWVSLELDSAGRLLIAREQKGILRMTLDESGQVEQVETVNNDLQECRGLLWQAGELFANANDSKALYRLRDSKGDDQFDEVTLLRSTEGGAGHGRNDLAEGAGETIHVIHGDSVEVPEEASLHTVSEKGAPKELGHWIETNADGTAWKILARGLRNPYGIAFNEDGEPFTYDADNEGDVGLPFYRPTRINHLVSGANYGWHQEQNNTRNMTVYAPDSWPTTFDVGRGSPTAVKFGTESHFPQQYRDALFALDWAYGRILAVHLTPGGASYSGSGEIFMEGRPLNVTDLDFAADGSMLFVTGGRKTRSALFRVGYTSPRQPPSSPTEQQEARATFSDTARKTRRMLERFHQPTDSAPDSLVWKHLDSPDPWIRNAARVALEFAPPDSWKAQALTGSNLTALLALSRKGSGQDHPRLLEKLSSLHPLPRGKAEQLIYLRICEWCLGETDSSDASTRDDLIAAIESMLPSPSPEVNKETCRVLALLEAPSIIDRTLEQFAAAGNQLDALHYLEVLAGVDHHWTPSRRSLFFRHLGYAKHFSQGDRFMPAFFEDLEKRALSHITDEQVREEMGTLLAEHRQKAPDPPTGKKRPFVQSWTLEDFSDEDLHFNFEADRIARGKDLYATALCHRCHVCGDTGFPSGPDLTRVAGRFSRRDLLASILEPSQVVAEVHRNHVVTLKDETTTMGRIVRDDFRKSLLYLSPNPFDPSEQVEINKNEIDSFIESPVSPMPPALLDTLTREEILTLLAWIESGGN